MVGHRAPRSEMGRWWVGLATSADRARCRPGRRAIAITERFGRVVYPSSLSNLFVEGSMLLSV